MYAFEEKNKGKFEISCPLHYNKKLNIKYISKEVQRCIALNNAKVCKNLHYCAHCEFPFIFDNKEKCSKFICPNENCNFENCLKCGLCHSEEDMCI